MSDRQITAMPAGFTPPVPFDACFDALYGLEVVGADVAGEGSVSGHVEAGEHLLAAHGAVQGGVFAAAAEALASRGTALTVIPEGFAAMGQGNDTTLLEPLTSGVIRFEAQVRSRGEDAWLWTVEARDEAGTLVAFSRVTVAVRPLRA